MDEIVRRFLRATNDPREVITDANARYPSLEVNDQSLVPNGRAHRANLAGGSA